jgi:hypothetical protein
MRYEKVAETIRAVGHVAGERDGLRPVSAPAEYAE